MNVLEDCRARVVVVDKGSLGRVLRALERVKERGVVGSRDVGKVLVCVDRDQGVLEGASEGVFYWDIENWGSGGDRRST